MRLAGDEPRSATSAGRPERRVCRPGGYFESDVRDCARDPARNVRITFSQGGREWKLGSFEVSEGARLSAKLEVPADAGPGRATVRATYEQRSRKDPRGETSVEARFFVTG